MFTINTIVQPYCVYIVSCIFPSHIRAPSWADSHGLPVIRARQSTNGRSSVANVSFRRSLRSLLRTSLASSEGLSSPMNISMTKSKVSCNSSRPDVASGFDSEVGASRHFNGPGAFRIALVILCSGASGSSRRSSGDPYLSLADFHSRTHERTPDNWSPQCPPTNLSVLNGHWSHCECVSATARVEESSARLMAPQRDVLN